MQSAPPTGENLHGMQPPQPLATVKAEEDRGGPCPICSQPCPQGPSSGWLVGLLSGG